MYCDNNCGKTEKEEKVLKKLPGRLAEAILKKSGLYRDGINEIRLRVNKPLVLTVNGSNVSCDIKCTADDIDYVVKMLCNNSLYSHSNTIREGYICAEDGIRAGICGQAVVENGRISVVRDITSVSIRIPRRVEGAADSVYELIKKSDFSANVLIYSKPGVGKTTVLRELAVRLSSGNKPLRVAVVDTRCEICTSIDEAEMIDILSGYPRSTGIETAVRTLSPQYIICDEIITQNDADAVLSALGSGVNICASVHADSRDSLFELPIIKSLRSYHAFDIYAGLIPSDEPGCRYKYDIIA